MWLLDLVQFVLAICQFLIVLAEAGVMHEAGYVYSLPEHLVPLPNLDILTSIFSFG